MKRLMLLLLACAACAAPSSYDGLSGGAVVDDGLSPPRPLSPMSVSYVATSRPRLRWALGGSLTGAIVEMCRARDCATVHRTFEASGRELVVPEDLEPGIWFWRLRGKTERARGTITSPTWEVLVRGPAKHGASDAPTGSLHDVDGDGLPDLVIASVVELGGTTDILYASFYGRPDGTFDDVSEDGSELVSPGVGMERPQYLAGGIDLDGDGFADLVHAGAVDFELFADMGRARGLKMRMETIVLPTPEAGIPSVREAGDTNGDGYGDLLVGKPQSAFVALGGNGRPAASFASVLLEPDLVQGEATNLDDLSRAVFGCFDANGDGVSDVVSSSQRRNILGIASPGDRSAPFDQAKSVSLGRAFTSSRAATAFASGDFDGDGVADLAYSAIADGAPRICIARGDAASLVSGATCIEGAASGLAAGDLEGDGVDELLVAGDGVKVIRWENGALVVGSVIPDLTAPITTLHPGRPGKARWAAATKDKRGVAVVEGTEERQRLLALPDVVGDFARALR